MRRPRAKERLNRAKQARGPSAFGNVYCVKVVSPHSASVLLVEDDRDIREAVTAVLEAEGYVVLTAENGREALKVLERAALRRSPRFDDAGHGWLGFHGRGEKDARARRPAGRGRLGLQRAQSRGCSARAEEAARREPASPRRVRLLLLSAETRGRPALTASGAEELDPEGGPSARRGRERAIVPPWAATMRRASARPSPDPPGRP